MQKRAIDCSSADYPVSAVTPCQVLWFLWFVAALCFYTSYQIFRQTGGVAGYQVSQVFGQKGSIGQPLAAQPCQHKAPVAGYRPVFSSDLPEADNRESYTETQPCHGTALPYPLFERNQ